MLKVFYLKDRYPEPSFRKSNYIELCLYGLGKNGILAKDRNNVINQKTIQELNLKDYTDDFDSFNTYYIDNKDSLLLLLDKYNCKVLYLGGLGEITELESIQLLCDSFEGRINGRSD